MAGLKLNVLSMKNLKAGGFEKTEHSANEVRGKSHMTTTERPK